MRRNNAHRAFFGKAYIGTAVPGDAVLGEGRSTTCYLKTKHTNKKVQQILSVQVTCNIAELCVRLGKLEGGL